MRRALLCLFVPVVVLTGCVVPYALPGLRTEVGDSWTGPREGKARFAIGAHLASSIAPSSNPLTRVDVGAGFLFETGSSSLDAPAREEPLTGLYADVGAAVLQSSFGRVIVGLRGEARATSLTQTHSKTVKLRVDAEVFQHVAGSFGESGRCGAIAGVYDGLTSIGLYAESGPAIYDQGHEWAATVGITARIPPSAGLIFGIPGCK